MKNSKIHAQNKAKNTPKVNSAIVILLLIVTGLYLNSLGVFGKLLTKTSGQEVVSDTIVPAVSLTYPTNRTKLSRNQVITLAADASDNVGVSSVLFQVGLVQKYIGAQAVTITLINQCTDATAPYVCNWTVPNTKNATYLFEAIATDPSGNRGISKYVELSVR